MNQQRARRFRSAAEQQELKEKAVTKGEQVNEDRFDSNCITPGTMKGTPSLCAQRCLSDTKERERFAGSEAFIKYPTVWRVLLEREEQYGPIPHCWLDTHLKTRAIHLMYFAGTPFMMRLSAQLKYFIAQKVTTDARWRGVTVIFSGPEVHIMPYCRLM